MNRNQLDEFHNYKNKLMEDLLTNASIVKLIDENKNLDTSKSLAYTQVFPCEYISETVEQGDTFICFDVDIQSAGKTYLSPTLYIWVFTHKSKLRLPEGGIRTDKLCSEIVNAINGSRNYGLGELELYSIKRFAPMTDFQGKVMTFYAKDYNRLSPNNKSIPSNRKREV